MGFRCTSASVSVSAKAAVASNAPRSNARSVRLDSPLMVIRWRGGAGGDGVVLMTT